MEDWDRIDVIYDVKDMTRYRVDSEFCYNDDYQFRKKRLSKARFVLKASKAEYVNALIDLSTEDSNKELTTLLLDLSQKLREGLIIYEDNPYDERIIGKEYDQTEITE